MPPLSPQPIMDAMTAYQRTAALKAAIALDVFGHARGGADAAELARRCDAAERGIRILCDTLTVQGFLAKDGAGRYSPSPESAAFLDRASPTYLGGIADFLAAPELTDKFMRDPAGFVRKGGAVAQDSTVSPDNPVWVAFARGMAGLMAMPAETLAEYLMKGGAPRRILDIAAGHGLFGIALARRAPAAELVALDWAKVVEVAAENAAKAGLGGRFRTIAGSAFEAEFGGPYDLVLLTNFLHHFDPDGCVALLDKCRKALAPGGRVAALEFVPEADRVSPPMPASFAFVMLASTSAGDAYTEAELRAMYERAGFARVDFARLPPTEQAAIVGTA